MSSRRLLMVALVAMVLVVPASAQRRRSVRSSPAAPPTGDCHVFNLVRPGLVASYLTNAPGGDVTFTITYISDTPTQTKTTQKVSTPQGQADVATTLDGEIVGNLRALKHLETVGSINVPGFGTVTTEVDIDFVPSLAAGPAAGWCAGATWDVPPVTETITTRSPAGTMLNTVTTIGSQGEVLAVGESITVTGGTYNTVKYRGVTVSGDAVSPVITWVSMEHNIVVKQDTLDAAGNVTSVTQLTKLQ